MLCLIFMWPDQGSQRGRSGTCGKPSRLLYSKRRAMHRPGKTTLRSPGLWVARRRLGLPGHLCDPHPSPPLLQVLVRRRRELFQHGNCPCRRPSQKLERALQSMCTLLWRTQLLNVVVRYGVFGRGVQRASGRAWSPWFSLNNPTSCT